MRINDVRGKIKELEWNQLQAGEVYTSHRRPIYVMKVQDNIVVCLETGYLYNEDECQGDVFTPVNATLVVE